MIRSRCRTALLAVGCVLALSGVAASTAAATETLSFVPKSGLFPVKKVTMKASTVKFAQGEAIIPYSCGSLTGEGEITGHKTAKMKLTLKTCQQAGGGTTCQSTGAKEKGEIVTATLPVELVYISKAHHEAGLDINYEGLQLASWNCVNILGKESTGFGIRHSMLAPITPVNTQTLTYKYTLSESKGLQTPASYETEAGSSFEAFPEVALLSTSYSKGAVSTGTQELKFSASEGEVEVKA